MDGRSDGIPSFPSACGRMCDLIVKEAPSTYGSLNNLKWLFIYLEEYRENLVNLLCSLPSRKTIGKNQVGKGGRYTLIKTIHLSQWKVKLAHSS